MIAIVIMLILAFAGIPLAFSILGSSLITLFLTDRIFYLQMAPNTMFNAINEFTFLAVPCFILAGNLMNKCGITKVLVGFCKNIAGHLVGGLAYVNIVASVLFAGITGSAIADTSAIGSVLIPMMKEDGYPANFSAAITVSSSIVGPIIPPSIIMVIYALVAGNVSIGAMFIAGFIPGLLIALALSIYVYYVSKKRNYPSDKRTPIKEIIISFFKAIPALLMPLIIVGGILFGFFTATEASVIAVVYAIFAGFFYFRSLKIKDLPEIFLETAITNGIVCIIISVARVLAWILSQARVPRDVAILLIGYTGGSLFLFVLIVLLLYVLLGCVFDPAAAIIITIPVLLPVAMELGIHPLHFGVFVSIAANLAVKTPPVGAALFVACRIANISLEDLSYSVLPFILITVFITFLIGYFPPISLILPRIFGFI